VGDVRASHGEPSLWQIQQILAGKRYVDLTHEFAPGIPHWPGFPDETRKTIRWYHKRANIKGTGFYELFTHVGQWGTHVDPPAHFIKGLRTVDQIDPKEMILPLVVIDVHEECAKNPDYTLSLKRVHKWEKNHGQIPAGAFVAMRTDWSKRWPDAVKMANKDADGVAHYPGWSLASLKYLYEQRKISASGHETTDTDPGIATSKDDYSLETYILSTNHYQIELLTNLDQLPEAGAIVVVSFPKPKPVQVFLRVCLPFCLEEICHQIFVAEEPDTPMNEWFLNEVIRYQQSVKRFRIAPLHRHTGSKGIR
jgi:kynurenine formamidase